jgi:hypothetical protein
MRLGDDMVVGAKRGQRVIQVEVGDGLYLVGAVPERALREVADGVGGPIKAAEQLAEKMIDTTVEAFRKKPKSAPAADQVSGCTRRHLCRWEPKS